MSKTTKLTLWIAGGLAIILLGLYGIACLFSPGTHGSIKGYRYSVTQPELQNATKKVIESNSNILHDKPESIDYYNDGKVYVTIIIKSGDKENEYTFRYYGSTITLCYAFDKNRNGGSGDEIQKEVKNTLTSFFETEFIYKLDKELNQKHVDTE